MKTVTIDLSNYSDRDVGVLAGRDRGEAVRSKENIAALDTDPNIHVRVLIPDWVFSVNSSFILGMLADSVRTLSPAQFRLRFKFEGPNASQVYEDLVRKAVLVGNPLAKRTA